jgi:hypothetical protein
MYARRVAYLWLTVAASFANGQYVLRKDAAAKVSAAIDGDVEGRKLDCQIERVKPFLDFAFRFEAGFVVRCPVHLFGGKAAHMVVYARVAPVEGETVILGQEYTMPEIPASMRALTNIRKLNNNFELSGGFALGEGDYAIDLLVADSMERFMQIRWKVKTVRARGEEQVPLTMAAHSVGPLASRPWDGKLAEKGQGVRVTLLLDAAPRDPNSTRLRVWDRMFLMDSVASVLRQVPCESVRLVAFNLEQQREIFRDERFDRVGFRRLGRALRDLELGTVEYAVLKRPRGWAELLANLTNQEVRAELPSDVVIFLGPVTRLMQKIPVGELEPVKNNRPRFFDFEYFPVWMIGGEFPDAIYHVTTARNGTILKIHSPGELARGIQRMVEQIRPSSTKESSEWRLPGSN